MTQSKSCTKGTVVPPEEATNARLASVSIVDRVIFLHEKNVILEKVTVVQTEITC